MCGTSKFHFDGTCEDFECEELFCSYRIYISSYYVYTCVNGIWVMDRMKILGKFWLADIWSIFLWKYV